MARFVYAEYSGAEHTFGFEMIGLVALVYDGKGSAKGLAAKLVQFL